MPSPYRRISIHALREEGDPHGCQFFLCRKISIHALREEGDREPVSRIRLDLKFLSTPSARRATQGMTATDDGAVISIHALREEGDTPTSRRPARS